MGIPDLVIDFTDDFPSSGVVVVLCLLAFRAPTTNVVSMFVGILAGGETCPQVDCWIEKGHGWWSIPRDLRKTKNGFLFGDPFFAVVCKIVYGFL